MCRNQQETWTITPKGLPKVIRNCSKCKGKTSFENSRKFRVNANGRLIDVWLIFRCEKCRTVWNMAIHERQMVDTIGQEEYEGFLNNDCRLAENYGTDPVIFQKNRAEAIFEETAYQIEMCSPPISNTEPAHREVLLRVPFPFDLRIDSLLSDQFSISRSTVKRWCSQGLIRGIEIFEGRTNEVPAERLLRRRIKDGLIIRIETTTQNKDSIFPESPVCDTI